VTGKDMAKKLVVVNKWIDPIEGLSSSLRVANLVIRGACQSPSFNSATPRMLTLADVDDFAHHLRREMAPLLEQALFEAIRLDIPGSPLSDSHLDSIRRKQDDLYRMGQGNDRASRELRDHAETMQRLLNMIDYQNALLAKLANDSECYAEAFEAGRQRGIEQGRREEKDAAEERRKFEALERERAIRRNEEHLDGVTRGPIISLLSSPESLIGPMLDDYSSVFVR